MAPAYTPDELCMRMFAKGVLSSGCLDPNVTLFLPFNLLL